MIGLVMLNGVGTSERSFSRQVGIRMTMDPSRSQDDNCVVMLILPERYQSGGPDLSGEASGISLT